MKPSSLRNQGCLYLLIYFALNTVLCSCNRNSLRIPEYIEYVRLQENGLLNSIEQNGYLFRAQYEPADYLTLKELRNDKITKENFIENQIKFTDYFYFDFSIQSFTDAKKVLDKTDSAAYENKFHYLSFDLSNDVFLVSKSDTLPCVLHQFVNNSGVSPEYHFELLFNKPGASFLARDTMFFCYNDRILNAGIIRIPILSKKITNIPQLKI